MLDPLNFLLVALLLTLVGSFLLTGVEQFLLARPLKKAANAPWTEIARRAFAVRLNDQLNNILFPMVGGAVFGQLALFGFLPDWPLPFMIALGALAAGPGPIYFRARFERKLLGPEWGGWGYWKNRAVFLCLYHYGLWLLVVLAFSLPPRFDLRAVVSYLAFLAVYLGGFFGGGLWTLEKIGLARLADGRAARIAAETAARAGVAAPEAWQADCPAANAFALFYRRRVVYTTALLRDLDDRELAAVTAHELGHLEESAAQKIFRSTALLLALPAASLRPLVALAGWWGYGAAVIGSLLALLAALVQVRRLEVRSDRAAVVHEDPAAYARGLEKIYRRALIPAVIGGKRTTHPELYDRLLAAGVTPDYSRPAPPDRRQGFVISLAVWVSLVALFLSLAMALPLLR